MYKDVKKKLIALVLSICMVATVIEVVPIVRAAVSSEQTIEGTKNNVSSTYKVVLQSQPLVYNGKSQMPSFIVKDNSGSSIFESTLYNADQVSFALYEKLFDIEGEKPTFVQGYYNDTDVEDNGKLIHFTAGDIAYRIGTIGYDA